MSFKLDDSMSTVGALAKLRGCFWEWSNMHVTLYRKTLLGFIIQNSLPANSRLKDEVDQRIKHLIMEDDKRPITMTTVLFVIESCRQQLQHKAQDSGALTTPAFHSTQLTTDVDEASFPSIIYPVEAYLEQISEEQWDQAIVFFARKATKCWNCGSEGHVNKDCKARKGTLNRNHGNTYSNPFPAYPPSSQPSIYPIFGAMYPPVQMAGQPPLFPQPPLATTQPPRSQPGLCQADYYRPPPRTGDQRLWKPNNPATAQMIELGSLPEDLSELLFNLLGVTSD